MNPRASGIRLGSEKEESMRRTDMSKFTRAGPGFSHRNVSRRRFSGISAGAAGGVLGAGLWTPARSEHGDVVDDLSTARPGLEQDPIPHKIAVPRALIGPAPF